MAGISTAGDEVENGRFVVRNEIGPIIDGAGGGRKNGGIRLVDEGEELLAELGRICAVAAFLGDFSDEEKSGDISLHF